MDLQECIAKKLHYSYRLQVAHAVPFWCQQVFWTVKQMALTETIMSVMKIKHSFLVKTLATTNLLRLNLSPPAFFSAGEAI